MALEPVRFDDLFKELFDISQSLSHILVNFDLSDDAGELVSEIVWPRLSVSVRRATALIPEDIDIADCSESSRLILSELREAFSQRKLLRVDSLRKSLLRLSANGGLETSSDHLKVKKHKTDTVVQPAVEFARKMRSEGESWKDCARLTNLKFPEKSYTADSIRKAVGR